MRMVLGSLLRSFDELRDLIGRILAGEVDKPGSVARKTVSITQDLTPHDLQEFLKLKAVAWRNNPLSGSDGSIIVLGKRLGLYSSEIIPLAPTSLG